MDSMASFFVIVLTAVVSSFFGFREWRKQLVLKKRHDLAEDVLALFYQCEGLFRHIRNVFGFQGEAADREPWPNETPGQKRDLDMAYVPVARYNENREAFGAIFTLRFRVMAVFGKEAAVPIEGLRMSLSRILAASAALSRIARMEMRSARTKRHEDVISGCLDDEDKFHVKILGLVKDMETICLPILNPPSTRERFESWCDRWLGGFNTPNDQYPPI
ncbi:MAG: hypothetical protein QGG25_18960 [Phycisphaerae bacterium]|nr:hypothetical protein [Phycisphaerae bacterium]